MAVVKANGYGHGAVPIAKACEQAGVGHFGVATLAEAGIVGNVQILGALCPDEVDSAVQARATVWVSSVEQVKALGNAARRLHLPVSVFLTIDSGMGREGCHIGEASEVWNAAHAFAPYVRLTGVCTHFSSADELNGERVTEEQTRQFERTLAGLPFATVAEPGLWVSLSNSPATLRSPRFALTKDFPLRGVIYRAGLLTYGIEPYPGAFARLPEIRPALSLYARVNLVRHFAPGATIGYGQTFTVNRPSRIATVGIGYGDGFPRRMGNGGTVLWRGLRLPIVGRVSMDSCQVDITQAPETLQVGETLTLIGNSEGAMQTVGDIARLIDTTPHEPTCLLTGRVPRVYKDNDDDDNSKCF